MIQKEEIQLFDISLHGLIEKHREEFTLENKGAPFIAIVAHLIYLKSLHLLPKEDEELTDEKISEILEFIDAEEYCTFQQAAKTFSAKQQEQNDYFLRGPVPLLDLPVSQEAMIPLGIEEFSRLFSQVWQQAQERCLSIVDEEWKVSDALSMLKEKLTHGRLLFNDLFSLDHSKEQLIATFLAMLELMKNQEVSLVKEQTSGLWYIIGTS